MAFKDYETEIPLNELLRNFENHRVKWLDSRDISKKEKKELSDSLDLIYQELQNQTLSERNEVRNFITNIEDTPANRRALGFLSGLLDSRPKQSKTEPEPQEVKLPKYSNNHLKYDFANRGWANGNEVDLGTWEAKDYNGNSFTGITNRVSQMKDFLISYRDNLKDEYDYSSSRYGNKENLIERLDTAIEILSNEVLTGEDTLDQITQALGALGWSSEEVKQLFRTTIPQPATTPIDPLVERADAVKRAQLEMEIEQAEQQIKDYRKSQSPESDFANYWQEKIVIPFKDLQTQTAIHSNTNPASIQIPHDKNWNEEGQRLYEILKNGELINQNDIQSLASLYEYYNKYPDLVKKVNGTNEIYLDTFIIHNKGIYYTYDPITKVIYKRRIQDNEDLYDLIKASYKKPVERPGFTPINKEGGVLKLQFGNYVPLPEIPSNPVSKPAENKNEKITDDTYVLDMTALGLDLAGLIASLFPGYGNLIGGVSGIAGSVTSFVSDWKRDGLQLKDGVQLSANLGSDIVGLIPGAGVIGKLAKVRKYGKPILTLLSLTNAGVSTYNIANKILDPNVKFKDITMDEWNQFAQAVIPLIVLGKNKKAESNLENILEQAPAGKNRNQLLDDVITSDFSTSSQKNAAQRAKWASSESNVDKTKQQVDVIWNADGTVKSKPKPEVTTSEAQIAETPTPKSKKVKTINEIPKKEVEIMRKQGYADYEIIRLFNKGKKQDGGKINYLTSLREGGIVKADNGQKFQELKIPTEDNNVATFVPQLGTQLSFNLEPYDYYLSNPGLKAFTNFEYKPETPFAIKANDLFNSELSYKFPVKSSKVGTLGTEYTPEIESTFKFKQPGVGAEITKALATIGFNNRQAKKAKEAIKPVYKSDVPVIAQSVKGDYEILDSYNRGIQNLYNQVATQTFNDPTLQKLTQLEAWSKQLNAGVQRDLAYAQSYKQSDAANLQTLQQAANQNYENDFYNDSVTASVAKAKSDIDSAKDYKNFTVGINSIDYLQKRNYDKANSYNQHALNAIQNQIYDKMYNELAGVTDVNEQRMIYRKYQNMIQNKINEFYGIPTYNSFQFNYQFKKGGKLDKNLQISKMLEKRYIEQLKRDEKKLDRLSKVTQKAILKSLGLK